MPKCVHSGCEQTAFYGQQFNRPMFCKAHAVPGTGSIRRKCKYGECMNAVFDTNDLCQRCRDVKDAVDAFAKSKFDALERTIAQEITAATSHQREVNPPPNTHPPRADSHANNIFAGVGSVGQRSTIQAQQIQTPTQTPIVPKKSGPKIVRTPDEPKVTTDSSLARKRAQTPGRVKSMHEVKSDA